MKNSNRFHITLIFPQAIGVNPYPISYSSLLAPLIAILTITSEKIKTGNIYQEENLLEVSVSGTLHYRL